MQKPDRTEREPDRCRGSPTERSGSPPVAAGARPNGAEAPPAEREPSRGAGAPPAERELQFYQMRFPRLIARVPTGIFENIVIRNIFDYFGGNIVRNCRHKKSSFLLAFQIFIEPKIKFLTAKNFLDCHRVTFNQILKCRFLKYYCYYHILLIKRFIT